ncbi:MAG TPA: DUF4097 family beta strand repeat-containing protein [Steroidobacteraceae bacterium]|nr:DUF4097 family beta strand repeat-containing protein [Steroidobacteraceae bacterium]
MTSRVRLLPNLLLASALLVFALPADAWDACRHQADRRASVDATGATSVVINARAGDLDLRPSASRTLAVAGRACASSEKFLQQTDVSVRREGTVIRVDVLVPDEMVGIGVFYASLDLTVDVPRGLPVELTDSSGDIAASDVRIAKLTDSSGDVVLHKLSGDIEIWDSSGDIRIEDTAGRVQVRDSSGDIVIVGAVDVVVPNDSSGDITVRRVSGDVLIEQDSSGDIRVSDVGGDVTVLGDSSGDVKVSSIRGSVRLPD